MKKILIFVDSLNEGGVTKVLLDLLENINREKYDITVMTLYNQGVYISEVKQYARYTYCFNIPNFNDHSLKAELYRKYWGGMLRLPESFMYKCFVKEKYDIEIAFMHGWSTKVISGSNNKKSKKIAWVHVDLVTWNRVDGVFKNLEHHKKAYSKFNEVICVSQTVKEGIEKKYNVKNARVLYNPINREKILKLSKEKIDDINLSNKFKLISVGRLSEQKGYDRLLRVFKKLKNDVIDIELILVGNGDKYNELNKYIGQATGGGDCPVEKAGLQILNGKQALSYARIRKGVGDDYERTERQREVLFKVVEKLQKTDVIKYFSIANKMLDYLRTNIGIMDGLNMAYTISKFSNLETEQLSIPVQELCVDEEVNGNMALRMDRYENALILNDFIFNDTLPDFILNRSTEKNQSIYYEYEGFGE